jgi:hypothetical protein
VATGEFAQNTQQKFSNPFCQGRTNNFNKECALQGVQQRARTKNTMSVVDSQKVKVFLVYIDIYNHIFMYTKFKSFQHVDGIFIIAKCLSYINNPKLLILYTVQMFFIVSISSSRWISCDILGRSGANAVR